MVGEEEKKPVKVAVSILVIWALIVVAMAYVSTHDFSLSESKRSLAPMAAKMAKNFQRLDENRLREFARKSAVIAVVNFRRLTPQYRDPHCWTKGDLQIERYLKGKDSYEASSFLLSGSMCHKDVDGPGEYVAVDWYDPPNIYKSVNGITTRDEGFRAQQQHEVYFFPLNHSGERAWSPEPSGRRQWVPIDALNSGINSRK